MKKNLSYPRTDARVLSTAVAKEIHKNIGGLRNYAQVREFADEILAQNSYKNIAKTRYVNDKQITDHYAVIPTGQGFGALGSLNPTAGKVYEIIVRRFLSIFYPPAEFQKVSVVIKTDIKEEPPSTERFYASFRVMLSEGYQKVTHFSFLKEKKEREKEQEEGEENQSVDLDFLKLLNQLKKGMEIPIGSFFVKEGETSPPKRYNSGSLILAMENAGQLIEDEELRAQIKGSGIGTSATRAEILKKLIHNQYLSLNKKTQIITPELLGEMIYEVVNASVPPLLNAELTASWEKGLTGVAQGTITEEEYMNKLNSYVSRRTVIVKGLRNEGEMRQKFIAASANYKKKESAKKQGAEKGMKTE